MNEHSNVTSLMAHNLSCYLARHSIKTMVAVLGFAVFIGGPVYAADPVSTKTAVKGRIVPISTEIAPRMEFSPGQSHLIRMPAGVNLQKVKVEDDKVVQVEVTSPREIVLHAKSVGSTSIMIWDKTGQVTVMDVGVVGNTAAMDATTLKGKLQQMLPNEKGIMVGTAGKSLVLSGTVTDAVKVDKAMTLAEAYAGKENKVINMLQVGAPQQVMLEVKVAEINRTEAEKLGFNFGMESGRNFIYGILGGNAAILSRFGISTGKAVDTPNISTIFPSGDSTTVGVSGFEHRSFLIDAQKNDGLIKILAEPNIVAISGQEGSFLAGGEILIPVPQANGTSSLESKLFGVGLRFLPIVLDEGRINMKIQPEVTDLVGFTSVATTGLGATTLVPTLTTRRISTTVELSDGQSFAIGGLLQDNTRESIKRFPLLGEIPILGALFRSTEFQKNKTELLIVVTPRLVKPLPANYILPTDSFKPPSRSEILLNGQLEGKSVEPATPILPPESAPKAPSSAVVPEQKNAQDGFEMK
jgi:pilus assembly protein CpaC